MERYKLRIPTRSHILILFSITIFLVFFCLFKQLKTDKIKLSELSCEDNGIQMAVQDIYTHDNQAFIYITLTDLTQNRFDETTSLYGGFQIQTSCEQVGDCRLTDYNPDTNTATFLLTLQQAQDADIEGENVIFSVSEIQSQKQILEEEVLDFQEKYLPVMEGKSSHMSADSAYLLPDKDLAFSPVSGVTISAYGFIEDKFHLQLFYDDLTVYNHSAEVFLLGEERDRLDSVQCFRVRDEIKKGRYDEYLFDTKEQFPYDNFKVWGRFTSYDTLLSGHWELSFPIFATNNDAAPEPAVFDALDTHITADGKKIYHHMIGRYSENKDMLMPKPYYRYDSLFPQYEEADVAKTNIHCTFDRQERLSYVLWFFGGNSSYCEETIFQWDDSQNTVRKVGYKANQSPYKDCSYVSGRSLYDITDYQFSQDHKILSMVQYYDSLHDGQYAFPFDNGYWAEYDGDKLRSELTFHTFVEYPYGSWGYTVYQYDETGKLENEIFAGENITLKQYQYDEAKNQLKYSFYELTQDYELVCEDGSKYIFYPGNANHTGWKVVEKITDDGTVEFTLYDGIAPSLTPEMTRYMKTTLMPEAVNGSVEDHYYTVQQGDCLTKIALEQYGSGDFTDLIYWQNIRVIGGDRNVIQPGQRLFLPELITSLYSKVTVDTSYPSMESVTLPQATRNGQ